MQTQANARRATDLAVIKGHGDNHTDDGHVVNGVRAPTPADDSYEVWAALNNVKKEWGAEPTATTATRLAATMGRDVNQTIVTFLQWKKFHEGV